MRALSDLPICRSAGRRALLGFQIEGPAVWVGRGQPVLLTVRVQPVRNAVDLVSL